MSFQSELLMPQYDYSLQFLFNTILKMNVFEKLSIKNISDNIFFKEKQTDILGITTEDEIPLLIEQGYKKTNYEDYTKQLINSVISTEEVTEYKIQNLNKVITVNKINIGITFNDNIVNIVQYNPYRLIKSLEYDFNIKDFFITEEGFVYILTEDTFIKSHITMDFYVPDNTHKCITKLEDIENLYVIKLDNIKQLLSVDDYYIYYMTNDNKFIKATLGKKYYFIKDNQVFFNVIDNTDKITVQIEHTHFYDWISLLGLNNFFIDGNKLSTKYTDKFKDILRFPFNSTLNGMLNYNDFLENKSYKIDKDIEFIKIEGNFNYEYKKGLFEIVVRIDKTKNQPNAKIHMELLHNGECVKTISGNTVDGIVYFCNLKFIFYKDTYETLIRIPIEIKDDYSVKIVKKYESINEKSLINSFDDLSKINQFFRRDSMKHQLIETDYENGHFIIRNYIKNSKERNFTNDFKVRLIEQDGTPSILWRQIKNKDYFLKLKNYLVTKKLKPKRSEKQLFSCENQKFKINLKEIAGIKRRR